MLKRVCMRPKKKKKNWNTRTLLILLLAERLNGLSLILILSHVNSERRKEPEQIFKSF